MPLTIDFRETIRERAQNDAAFRRGLLQEAVELMLSGDVRTGQKIIRNYINATVGFHDFGSLYSNNVGLGLRYATPVGPVRIDVGRNLDPVPGIGATQYFISIGQAF